jgi:hypothetical protein
MKKLYFILIITISAFTITNGQFTKIGGGLAYGTSFYHNNEKSLSDHRTPHFAISATGIYEINLKWHIAPSFTFFYPHITKFLSQPGYENRTTVTEMMFDLNGHYVFNSLDKFEFYGLAGMNITFEKIKFLDKFPGGESKWGSSINAPGLNIGAGTYLKITEQLDLFVEAKYIVSKYDQFMLNAGVLVNLQWLSKNETPGL